MAGSISVHLIRSQTLTPSQVLSEAQYLQTLYPPIPNVQIGDQHWQTSNFEAVATPLGNIITEITENANVEKVTNSDDRDFTTDTGWWSKIGESTIGGVANILSTEGVFSSIVRNSLLTAGERYYVSFEITRVGSGGITFGGFTEQSFSTLGVHTFVAEAISSSFDIKNVATCDIDVDNLTVQSIGWAGSQVLYNGLISQGETIYEATLAAAMWCHYNNDPANGAIYGKLYNWFAVSLLQQDIDLYNIDNPTEHWGTTFLHNQNLQLYKQC